jgi:iron complex transport system substrate-binding protein
MAWQAAAIRVGREGVLFLTAVALLLSSAAIAPGRAAGEAQTPPRRIVSIHACTDQLLFALADRQQVAALTRYAVDASYSIYRDEIAASGIKLIAGAAEEVLKLKPDLVLAGTFTRRATRELLAAHGVRLELFPPTGSIEESKEAIRRAAALFGHTERGDALNARIDQRLAAAPQLAAPGLSVLQLQRRGFVSGPETLLGDLLERMGIANAASALGIRSVGRSSLEAALKAKADAILLFDPAAISPDQGSALLRHPALAAAYPPERRITMPGRLLICGGPALPEAVTALSEGLGRLTKRGPAPQ